MAEVCYGEDLSLLPSAGKLSEYEKRGIRVVTRDTLENTIPFMSLRDLPHLDDGTLLEIDEAILLRCTKSGKIRIQRIFPPAPERFLLLTP